MIEILGVDLSRVFNTIHRKKLLHIFAVIPRHRQHPNHMASTIGDESLCQDLRHHVCLIHLDSQHSAVTSTAAPRYSAPYNFSDSDIRSVVDHDFLQPGELPNIRSEAFVCLWLSYDHRTDLIISTCFA